MTPQQEERLGQMMLEHACQHGQVSKIPPDPFYRHGPHSKKTDVDVIAMIELTLRIEVAPVSRGRLISLLEAETTQRIDKCLRKMEDSGAVRRIPTWSGASFELLHDKALAF